MIAGIVLAAGASRRLGTPKQLLPLGAGTILDATLTLARQTVRPIVVVLGAAEAAIRAQVDLHDVQIVTNPDFATGQASSLRAGLQALEAQPEIKAVIVLLGDQPLIPVAVLTALIQAWHAKPALLAVAPGYGGQRGNPVLFARAAWPVLATLTGDAGARPLFAAGALDPWQIVGFPAAWWPADVDTLADYQALLAAWQAR